MEPGLLLVCTVDFDETHFPLNIRSLFLSVENTVYELFYFEQIDYL